MVSFFSLKKSQLYVTSFTNLNLSFNKLKLMTLQLLFTISRNTGKKCLLWARENVAGFPFFPRIVCLLNFILG